VKLTNRVSGFYLFSGEVCSFRLHFLFQEKGSSSKTIDERETEEADSTWKYSSNERRQPDAERPASKARRLGKLRRCRAWSVLYDYYTSEASVTAVKLMAVLQIYK